jgi:hypothetical protein
MQVRPSSPHFAQDRNRRFAFLGVANQGLSISVRSFFKLLCACDGSATKSERETAFHWDVREELSRLFALAGRPVESGGP